MGILTYDVAVSLDGFIAGPGGDVSQFPMTGDHVDAYFERMRSYDAVVMGRKTYEFGYQHGLKPGDAPYPGMHHFVVSKSLQLPSDTEVEVIREDVLEQVLALKSRYASIYLCGGGALAGALLDQGLIDVVCLKLAPVVIGAGTKLFTQPQGPWPLVRQAATNHASGVTTLRYHRD